MANRALTIAEMKAMLDNLADKVKEEGAELYQDIREKLDELETAASKKAEEITTELGPKLKSLRDKIEEEGEEVLDAIEERYDYLKAEVEEELAELKEKGVMGWAYDNPMIAGAIIAAVVGVILVIVL